MDTFTSISTKSAKNLIRTAFIAANRLTMQNQPLPRVTGGLYTDLHRTIGSFEKPLTIISLMKRDEEIRQLVAQFVGNRLRFKKCDPNAVISTMNYWKICWSSTSEWKKNGTSMEVVFSKKGMFLDSHLRTLGRMKFMVVLAIFDLLAHEKTAPLWQLS